MVAEEPRPGRRRLATLYWNAAPLFASRETRAVVTMLNDVLALSSRARYARIYWLNPCEIDGRKGIYVRDLFNRSPYRMRLQRHGVRFSATPWVEFEDSDVFRSREWDVFRPEFAIVNAYSDDDPSLVVAPPDAMTVFQLLSRRVGDISLGELKEMPKIVSNLSVVGSGDPGAVVGDLRERWARASPA